jgi:dimethylaniline monooxygenase (N-oxide forming)
MVIHSSYFKGKERFGIGKDILIVGSGETDMDNAFMAVTADTKSATLSHCDGSHVAPKVRPPPKLHAPTYTNTRFCNVRQSAFSLA